MGTSGIIECLKAGSNDLGGTLMNESISRAAGNQNGQELPPEEMDELIRNAGRIPKQRTTKYGRPETHRCLSSYHAPPLMPLNKQNGSVTKGDLLQRV